MGYTRRSPIRNSIRKESNMRKLLLLLSSLLLIWACSTKDDENIVSTKQDESNSDILDTSFIEILSLDSCFAMHGVPISSLGVDTFYVKKYDENFYSIRILTNRMCPPSEPPDFVNYSYFGDTLIVSLEKKDPTFGVVCCCFLWADLLIKKEIDFNYIHTAGGIFVVKKEFDEIE